MLYDCYNLIADVRRELNEYSSAYVEGTDTTGKYQNEYLLTKINQAYRYLYALLIPRIPGYFYVKVSIAGVASVYTMPGDMGRLLEVRDERGYKVVPVKVSNIPLDNATGEDNEYFRTGNSITINKAGITATYVFYYVKKSRDLDFGQATAGGAGSITLATSASKAVDFYNGMEINNITQDWSDTITDYTTGRVATISETAAIDDFYGLVPEIPESFHHLIAPKAVQLTKASFPIAQERPTAAEMRLWNDMLAEAIRSYGCEDSDVPLSDVFGGRE